MNILLVGPDFEENLSLRYLASSLTEGGHLAFYATFNGVRDYESVVAATIDVDLVGLSVCFQARAGEYLELARRIKTQQPNLTIVAGGHFASCAAHSLLQHHPEIDLIVLHEGEQTLVEIANAGANLMQRLPTISGVAYRDGAAVRTTQPRSMVPELDHLPPPDRSGPVRLQAGIPIAYLLGSRGCLGSCTYCCITTLHRMAPGKCFRQRAPQCVADEMASLYHERGVRQFVFHDDNFLVPSQSHNEARLRDFAAALKQRKVRDIGLVIKCRPQDAHPLILRQLRDLGLLRVFLGIETASAQGLQCFNRAHSVEQARATLRCCTELGISAQFTLMIFYPEANMTTVRADIAFMRQHLDYAFNFCRAEIYAGTPLEQRMLAEGRAYGNYLGRAYTLLDPSTDQLCQHWTRIFRKRCGDAQGLMNTAIGLDYRIAVLEHFFGQRAIHSLRDDVRAWCREVRADSVDILEELAALCVQAPALDIMQVDALGIREKQHRVALEQSGVDLAQRIARWVASTEPSRTPKRSVFAPMARQAAALVLASMPAACTLSENTISEMAAPPMDTGTDHKPDGGKDSATDAQTDSSNNDAD